MEAIAGSQGIDLKRLKRGAASACALLKALAHEDRLLLLCQLSAGELCVSDIEARSGIHQPSLSQQLAVLRNARLLATRREGTRIYYRLASHEATAVMQTLYEQFCAPKAKR